MGEVKKGIVKRSEKDKDKSLQLALFELMDTSDSDYSNTIELYDALPKYVWAGTEADNSENSVITRQLKSRGVVYTVKIKPAVIERKAADGSIYSTLVYPGSREEIVEEALRKIAVMGNSFESPDDKEVGVFFTVSQLRKELARTKHSYSAQEVLEALDVMSSSLLECSLGGAKGSPRDAYRGNLLAKLAIVSRDEYLDGNARCFATFHPLVTHGIKTQNFRLYDYGISMTLKSDLARYMYKRMSHYWTQASLENPYTPNLVSFLESSPRGLSDRMKENLRAMRNALTSLASKDVILPKWDEEVIKAVHDKRVTTDVKLKIYPSASFIKHMMKANKRHSDMTGKLALAEARDITKESRSLPRAKRPDQGGDSDNVFD